MSEKKLLGEDEIDWQEFDIYGGKDSLVAVTRADSLGKQTLEQRIIQINLEKRKAMMQVEARRELLGDEVADRMARQLEEQYQRKLTNIDLQDF